MTTDQMRDEFESWAKRNGCDVIQAKGEEGYWLFHTHLAWLAWQAAYAAGRKAERETIRKLVSPEVVAPLIKLSEVVNEAIQRSKPEGER